MRANQRAHFICYRMLGKGEPDEARVTECKQQLSKNLDVYEKILSKQTYLAGEVSASEYHSKDTIRSLIDLHLG